MKTIIAGSRSFCDYDLAERVIIGVQNVPDRNITRVISGTARGADKIGEKWAAFNATYVERHPADLDQYGKRAGYLRNVEMAKVADCVIVLWDGQSRGSQHMINIALNHGLPTFIYNAKTNRLTRPRKEN